MSSMWMAVLVPMVALACSQYAVAQSQPQGPPAAAAAVSALRGVLTPADNVQPTITIGSVGPAAVTVQNLREGLCQTGEPQLPVVELTISQAHAAMLDGKLSCSGLVAAYQQRIDAYDQSTHLNSIHAINPHVKQRAADLDGELEAMRANGTSRLPPLFCVPLLLKDNIDAVGIPTTAGSAGLNDNYPLRNARVVDLLQQQGALVLAKTSMGEFAFFPSHCISSASGVVRNPYNLGHTPAGSSGGSAAAAAASFGMVALGTDTGNSVRGPASHAALVGLRASLGLISRTGVVPLRIDRDMVGPMTRTVEDAVRVLAMVGHDPADPLTQLVQNVALPENYTQFLDPSGLVGARIGVMSQISNLPTADPAIQSLFELALQALRQAGATLVTDFRIIGNSMGLDWDANRGGQGPAKGHWNVRGRWEDLWGCQAPFREGIDAYLAAGNTSTRYRSLSDIYAAGAYHPEVQEEVAGSLRASYSEAQYPTPSMTALGMVCGCSYFWQDPCRLEFRQRLVQSMDDADVDALVYPTWNSPPLKIGERVDNSEDGNNSPMIAPHTGSPAITVPMGYTGPGLPAGLQFLARPFDEPTLIRLAYAYEQATQHRRQPPMFPECRSRADTAAGRNAQPLQNAG